MQIRAEKEQERFLRKLSVTVSASQPIPLPTTPISTLPQFKFKSSWPGKVYRVNKTCLVPSELIGTELERKRISCLVPLFHRNGEQSHCISLAMALSNSDFINILSPSELENLRKSAENSLLGPIYDERGSLLKSSFVIWTPVDKGVCRSTANTLPRAWQSATPIRERVVHPEPTDLVHGVSNPAIETNVSVKVGSKIRNSVVFTIVATVILLSGQKFWQNFTTHEETDNAKIQGHIHEVDSHIYGTVSQVLVSDNEFVRKGQILVVLDRRDNDVKVEQAETALNTALQACAAAQTTVECSEANALAERCSANGNICAATASVNNAKAVISSAEAGVVVTQAHVAEAAAVLQKTKEDFERCSSLNREGITSARDLNSARAAFEIAQAQKNAAENEVNRAISNLTEAKEGLAEKLGQLSASSSALNRAAAAEKQVELSKRQYKMALSAVQQAKANLAEAGLAQTYTHILAPASGRIAHKTIEIGKRIQPGQCVMAIVENDCWITANFKETQIARLHPGQSVTIKIDAFPGRAFQGHLDSIAPASTAQFAMLGSDNATGNFTKIVQRVPAKILLDPESIQGFKNRITPGMSAVVSVNLNGNEHHGT